MKGAQLFADSYRYFTSDSGGPVRFFFCKDSIFEDHIFFKGVSTSIQIRREKLYEIKCHDLDLNITDILHILQPT